ncbi:MAG: hypothetical protein ACODAE_02160 [Gemmatimonadota bacterium]
MIRPPGFWILTVGRLVVLYIAATFFGANVAMAVDAWEAGGSAIGPIVGAIAMSALSLYVLTRSYRQRPASGKGPGSESSDRG